MSRTVVLAFDIERTGACRWNETIAIGASVVNEKFEQIDQFLYCAYDDQAEKSWEERCWKEFGEKNKDVIESIKANTSTSLSPDGLRVDMIDKFVEFVAKWEKKAKEEGFRLERVTDNSPFDVHFLNDLIHKWDPARKPFPYTMSSPQEYSTLIETHSLTKGLLMMYGFFSAKGPEFVDKDWGMWPAVQELWDVGKPDITHDHMPNHDAYTIAWEFQKLAAIAKGEIRMLNPFPKKTRKKRKKGDDNDDDNEELVV